MKNFFYRHLAKWGYKIENKKKRKAEILRKVGIYGVKKNISLVMRQHNSIANLQSVFPDLTISDQDSGLLISFSGLQFYVESSEEIFIISEVFYEKDYNFISHGEVVLIDIGANIGVSSLFFSRIPNIAKIYAFEPVADTYSQAVVNISANKLENRIIIENIGLGKNDRVETFQFNKYIKGNTGVRGTMSESYAQAAETEARSVQIKDAVPVFEKIIRENPAHRIIVKMDCEGAEYEIIERLQSAGILSQVDAMLIEWHDKGAAAIEESLAKSKFFIFSRQLERNSGMIYAKK